MDIFATSVKHAGVPDIRITVGDRVRELRQAKGISQEDLAEKAGLDRTYISSIERGKRNISLLNIERLAKALSVKPHQLLQNETLSKK